MAPHKIWTRGEKGPHFLALFGLSAINQYFLVTLIPHRLNVPAHSNFSMRSHSDNHLLFRKKKTLETCNDIYQLIVHFAVMPSVTKISALQLDNMQLRYLQCS